MAHLDGRAVDPSRSARARRRMRRRWAVRRAGRPG